MCVWGRAVENDGAGFTGKKGYSLISHGIQSNTNDIYIIQKYDSEAFT